MELRVECMEEVTAPFVADFWIWPVFRKIIPICW